MQPVEDPLPPPLQPPSTAWNAVPGAVTVDNGVHVVPLVDSSRHVDEECLPVATAELVLSDVDPVRAPSYSWVQSSSSIPIVGASPYSSAAVVPAQRPLVVSNTTSSANATATRTTMPDLLPHQVDLLRHRNDMAQRREEANEDMIRLAKCAVCIVVIGLILGLVIPAAKKAAREQREWEREWNAQPGNYQYKPNQPTYKPPRE